jgi:hypothetical protein
MTNHKNKKLNAIDSVRIPNQALYRFRGTLK